MQLSLLIVALIAMGNLEGVALSSVISVLGIMFVFNLNLKENE